MAELYGVIHLPSLRTPDNLPDVLNYALTEARKLENLEYDGLIIENFHDQPFQKTRVSDQVAAKLAVVSNVLQYRIDIDVGLNILRNACVQAMSIAAAVGLNFIRCNIWEGAYVTDQGIIEGAAYDVVNCKSNMQTSVKVYADIMVKHASPMGSFSLIEAAEHAVGRGGADRIILSGKATGDTTPLDDVKLLTNMGIKPMLGSGLTMDNMEDYQGLISGAIIGTAIKETDVSSPIDMDKARDVIEKWRSIYS